mmetsp:Transcript_80800/g.232135  ORF Transcript_80800/g.232135 Transcript_80800/m.232135 type:complete len:210 (+) Transcript_80800:556-1185(+)
MPRGGSSRIETRSFRNCRGSTTRPRPALCHRGSLRARLMRDRRCQNCQVLRLLLLLLQRLRLHPSSRCSICRSRIGSSTMRWRSSRLRRRPTVRTVRPEMLPWPRPRPPPPRRPAAAALLRSWAWRQGWQHNMEGSPVATRTPWVTLWTCTPKVLQRRGARARQSAATSAVGRCLRQAPPPCPVPWPPPPPWWPWHRHRSLRSQRTCGR